MLDELLHRTDGFADSRHDPALGINPTLSTTIVSCVDPRVDPALLFRLAPGEATVIRNVGGRVTPSTIETLVMIARIGQANGRAPGTGSNLIVLQHTDCGITDLAPYPALLAAYFGVPVEEVRHRSVGDPDGAVQVDVELLKATASLPAGLSVTGAVYDVATGRVRVVTPPERLRTP